MYALYTKKQIKKKKKKKKKQLLSLLQLCRFQYKSNLINIHLVHPKTYKSLENGEYLVVVSLLGIGDCTLAQVVGTIVFFAS